MTKEIKIRNIKVGGNNPFCLIAGPCVIENENMVFSTAEYLKNICEKLSIPLIFKSSFDKANRSSISSYRGPGIEKGLEILNKVRERFDIPITSDIHCISQIKFAAEILDLIQIPAFLSRQTDLIVETAKTKKPLNIKKGQFLAPWDMKNVIEKATSTGNENIMITERGTCFGYNNLVSDFRSLPIMRKFGYPVIFDATHSVQQPGGLGKSSGGNREFVPYLAKGAIAVGCDGIFMEVHPEPEEALSDGPNMVKLDEVEKLLKKLKEIERIVKNE